VRAATAPAVDAREATVLLVTPENVPVRFAIARVGDRAAAFAIDALILVVTMLLVGLFAVGLSAATGSPVGFAIVFLAFFLLRNFYFTWFEIRRHGQTPGKKRVALRVVDRRGGPLAAEAVFVRNAMREIELFIPLIGFFAPQHLFPTAGPVGRLVALLWVFLLAAMPLFNRLRLRVGDIVAGTMVVRIPQPLLLHDVSEAPQRDARAPSERTFTPEQLGVYGIYELQVLEDLLRREEQLGTREAMAAVAKKIRKKIGARAAPGEDDAAFLREFYAAQRAWLEGKLVLGTRRERKDG